MQHCTYKLLSWDLRTLQLQKYMYFAHLSYSSAPPRAEGDLHSISSILKHGNAAATEEREGAETSPPDQTPVAFAGLFLPVLSWAIAQTAAPSPSRHGGPLSIRIDSSSTILILDISSILVWALYLF